MKVMWGGGGGGFTKIGDPENKSQIVGCPGN